MIDFLHEYAEFNEGVRLSLARDFILDAIGEFDVEAPMESSMTPIANLTCQSIPFNDVLHDMLRVVLRFFFLSSYPCNTYYVDVS